MKLNREQLVHDHRILLGDLFDAQVKKCLSGEICLEDYTERFREYIDRYVKDEAYDAAQAFVDYLLENINAS